MVDAGSKEVGAALMEKITHAVVYYASLKHLTRLHKATCSRIEKLLLLYTHFHQDIHGMPQVEVETDHKSLEAILKKILHQIQPTLQKMVVSYIAR